MISAKSVVGVLCYVFLMILGLQTFSDFLKKQNTGYSMFLFTTSAIALILLGTYLIKIGEKERQAKKVEKEREKLLKDITRVSKLK